MTWVNNGLAVLIVVAGGYGILKVCSWSGQHVVLPLRDAAIGHLNKTNEMLSQNCETQRQTQRTMESIGAQMATMQDEFQAVKQTVLECHRIRP